MSKHKNEQLSIMELGELSFESDGESVEIKKPVKKPKIRCDSNVSFRLDQIKELLEGKQIKSLVNFEEDDDNASISNIMTGNHSNKAICKHKCKPEDCFDVTCIVDRQYMDFRKLLADSDSRLNYIKSGSTGHTFMGVSKKNPALKYGIKVVAFPKKENYGNFNDRRRPENAELLMIKILSYFVINSHTPHIVLPIAAFNANIDIFTEMKIDNKRFTDFIESNKKGIFYDKVSILMSEWADCGDLLMHVRKNYKDMSLMDWKVIFFQILSTLAVIQLKYPTFRHNDLKANNILVHSITLKTNQKYKYIINEADDGDYIEHKFLVPNVGVMIKIWDFDFSSIPGKVDNSKVCSEWTNEINVTPDGNKYYDMHYFFNSLIRPEFFKFYDKKGAVPEEVRSFIDRVVPNKYKRDQKTSKILEFIDRVIPKKYKDDKLKARYDKVREFFESVVPDLNNDKEYAKKVKKYIETVIPEQYIEEDEYKLIQEFLARILTSKYKKAAQFKLVSDKGRILINKEFLTPLDVINKDPFFKEFKLA